MTNIRMTLMFEKVTAEGAILDETRMGGFVTTLDAEEVAELAAQTVSRYLPEFLERSTK